MGAIPILLAACASRPTDAEARRLVERLGSDAVEDRDVAYSSLLNLGEGARPALEEGAKDPDSEIACRCRELLDLLTPREREIRRVVAHWLRHAYREFDQDNYARCIMLCKAALTIDPTYSVATTLRDQAEKARHASPMYSFSEMHSEWERQTDMESGSLPKQETFRYPPAGRWPELFEQASIHAAGVWSRGNAGHDPACIELALDTRRVTLAIRNGPVDDILMMICDASGLVIIVDAGLSSPIEPQRRMDLNVENQSVRTVLAALLRELKLDYCITRENVVLLTAPGKAGRGRR